MVLEDEPPEDPLDELDELDDEESAFVVPDDDSDFGLLAPESDDEPLDDEEESFDDGDEAVSALLPLRLSVR